MRIYLSGKITGTDDYMARFQKAEQEWQDKGWEVINPAKTSATLPILRHCQYMEFDLVLLKFCDAIYMLDGWMDSEGALEEYRAAKGYGLQIIKEGE